MSVTLTEIDAILKDLYPRGIHNEILKESPLLAMLPKFEDFVGRRKELVVQYAGNRNRSADFATAVGGTSNAETLAFWLTRKKNYASFVIDRETMKAAKTDKGALVDALSTEMESAIATFRQDLSSDAYGTGSGKRGQIATGGISGSTITLSDANDTIHFEVGDVVVLSTANGGGSVKSGTLTVSKVDRDTGILTTTVAVTTGIATAAAGDYIFKSGDYDAKATGLAGWIPSSTPSATPFFSVDRTVDATRLAGIRFDGSAMNHEEALQRACARFQRHGARPKHIFMHPEDVSALELILGSKKVYEDVESEAGIGFTAVVVNAPYGKVRVFGDAWATKSRAYALTLDTWGLHSLGKVAEWIDEDGNKLDRQASADGFQGRLAGYYNFACEAPGQSGTIALATV